MLHETRGVDAEPSWGLMHVQVLGAARAHRQPKKTCNCGCHGSRPAQVVVWKAKARCYCEALTAAIACVLAGP